MALTTIDKVKDWADPGLGTVSDTALQACIEAASAWIVGVTGQHLERTDRYLVLHGRDAVLHGLRLYLPRWFAPYVHTVQDPMIVTEDQAALTLGELVSDEKDVILVGANARGATYLHRDGSWISDVANVTVTCKTGYTEDEMPLEVVQLANEVTVAMFRQGPQVGAASVSVAGHATSIQRELSPQAQHLLNAMNGGQW